MPVSVSSVGTEPITVLVIDDHPLLRDGIAFALQPRNDIRIVGEATDGQEGVELFKKVRPDVVLVDLQMPRMNGIEAITAMRSDYAAAKFIVLTTYSGDAQVVRALKAGAAGYLLKGTLRKDLVDTILAVHAGHRRIPGEIAANILGYVSGDDLTSREVEILRIVAKGNSNKAVASHFGLAEETVKGHMKNILLKLGANDRTHAVTIAMKRGFLDS
jgi:DNA-binding NarL/FixJ family response regulator